MRLRAERAMVVNLADLDLTVSFERGEDILTEISAKFRRATVAAELGAGRLRAGPLVDRPSRRFRPVTGLPALARRRILDDR